ncbi:ATP-binding cassette domain-containing protein [Brachybacterium hainanense]|uniref:ATP-binding cassette domain-containing protein n=1 Tax=Brachybacterium hainanense TaxID=1541174 RepID=A0ABV6RD63_9MICO
MSLEIEDLTVTTSSGRRLLDGASWQVPAGGRLGVIGESGSGKSLTAQAVLGLLPEGMRATGSVRLDGEELLGKPERALRRIRGRRIAMVFQEPLTALDPLMSIGKQIEGPLRLHTGLRGSAARDRVVALLDMVALRDHDRILRSYPWQLSGGQRQRVALAMALACEPEVLIADEPTTALDVTLQDEILTLLAGLIEDTGVSLVFVSHDLPVVARVAEDLVVMREGRVVETGPAARVLAAPASGYAQDLITAARSVTALPGRGGPPSDPPEENR